MAAMSAAVIFDPLRANPRTRMASVRSSSSVRSSVPDSIQWTTAVSSPETVLVDAAAVSVTTTVVTALAGRRVSARELQAMASVDGAYPGPFAVAAAADEAALG